MPGPTDEGPRDLPARPTIRLVPVKAPVLDELPPLAEPTAPNEERSP